MPDLVRIDPPSNRRWVLGVSVSSDCSRMAAALVTAAGQGLAMRAEVGEGITAQLPAETSALYHQLADPSSSLPAAAAAERLAALRHQLAEHEASLVDALLAQARRPLERILAVGVLDPGLWTGGRGTQVGHISLCDPARLAETTGLNVVDAFPARDVARGGQGGPLTAVAQWVFLRSTQHGRLLVDLGRTARLVWLPKQTALPGVPNLLAFDVGPGTLMLDLLAQRLTAGEQPMDPGGTLAVQGRRVPELIDHWMSDPYFRRSLPRWHPRGVRPERFLLDAMKRAVDAGWSVRDILCTATHFIAEAVDRAIRERLPQDLPIDEIVLTGGGQHNGLLLREATQRLPPVPVRRIQELGISHEVLRPACAGLLALFHLDHVPGNTPEVTGAEVSRVLGRLTPGSPQAWQRLLLEMSGNKPTLRPLRSAL